MVTPPWGKTLFPALMEENSRETEEVIRFGIYFGVRFFEFRTAKIREWREKFKESN